MSVMPFKISLFRKEMMKHSGRSAGWISLLYLLVLIFCFPLNILMTVTNEQRELWPIESLFNYNFEIQIILFIAAPVLLAIFLFRFLNVKESSDLFHSMPIKREQIFHQYTLYGLFYLIAPVLITTLLLWIEILAFDLQPYLSTGDIFYWFAITTLLNIIIYMGAVFTGMFTGISFVQGVLSYIFLLLPSGLILLVSYNLQFFLYGFPEDYFMNNSIEYFSPLVVTNRLAHEALEARVIVSYAIISVILYVAALWVYKKRRSEAVSHAIVFPILKPIFTFGTMVCTAFLAALYFGETQNHSINWLIFGYISGSLVGYFAAQMVLNKTWRVFGKIKNYLIYAGSLVILLLMLHFDVIQYENKVPELEDIAQVHFSDKPYLYNDTSFRKDAYYLKSKENLTNIRQLHLAILKDKIDPETIRGSKYETAFFAYELKNGRKVVREYTVDKSKFKPFYQKVQESEEYKQAVNEIFQKKTKDMKLITIQPYGPVNTRANFSDPEEIEELVSILKEEIHSASYEEMNDTRGLQSYISILLTNNNSIDLAYKPSYKKLDQWLEQKDVLDKAKVSEKDIDYAVIMKKDELSEEERKRFEYDPGQIFNERKGMEKITNPADIKLAMNQSQDLYIWEPEIQYIIAFYFKNESYPIIRCFDEENLPEFAK
jgi:ABC-2 type transport system permease protein